MRKDLAIGALYRINMIFQDLPPTMSHYNTLATVLEKMAELRSLGCRCGFNAIFEQVENSYYRA